MKTVQPFRSLLEIEKMKNELSSQKSGVRDLMLFIFGINSGLRISDILKFKVSDVKEKTHIILKEQKTSKAKRFIINTTLKKCLDDYIENMQDNDYLFQSQKGNNLPIKRMQAYRILNKSAKNIGIDEIGTHTLRKTFGYHYYKRHKNVAWLQELFNHSSPSTTLRYIGVNQDVLDNSMMDFSL